MAAATLADLQNWITNYAGPIVDSAMYVADAGPTGQGPVRNAEANPDQRTPLMELVHRVNVARAALALPAANTGSRWNGASAWFVAQNWAAALANWLITWNYPNW